MGSGWWATLTTIIGHKRLLDRGIGSMGFLEPDLLHGYAHPNIQDFYLMGKDAYLNEASLDLFGVPEWISLATMRKYFAFCLMMKGDLYVVSLFRS